MSARKRTMTCIVGCVASLAMAAGAVAADWPQWRGPNGEAKVSDFNAPQTWPKELKQQWNETVGTGDATPALVGDKLYVFTRQGADEVLRCMDVKTGKTLWEDKHAPGVSVSGAPGQHPGPRSSPAVGDGKVVTIGVSGILSCLDAESGKLLWRQDPYKSWPKFYTASSPIIVDDMCVAELGGDVDGAIMGLDVATGNPKWKTAIDGATYSTPVVATIGGQKQIVAYTAKKLMGLSLDDGKVLWEIPEVPQRMTYNAVTPVIEGDVIFVTGQGKGAYAIQVEKQENGFKPKELWTNPDANSGFSTPVLKDGLLYALTSKASFFCLDAKTGKTLWTSPPRPRERGFGSLVDAGQVILALTPSAELIVIKPNDKEFTQLASIKVSDAQPYAYPVVSGNKVIIKGQDAVTLFTIE
ncbi:MAG TPA: PQQ-binding-like beta-propeller repeat protein [Tepidisphaeraceae bacterium]